MSTGLSRGDRWLLLGAAALFLVLVVADAFTGDEGQAASIVPTIYTTTPGGARGAWLLLDELHHETRVWEDPPSELMDQHPERHPLLIIAEPAQDATVSERKDLETFVEAGGRVLFCGMRAKSFFRGVSVVAAPGDAPHQFSAALPSRLSAGAQRIHMEPRAYWRDTRVPAATLYGDEHESAVVEWPKGKGEVIWWAAATPLTNAGIRREDNLQLFLNSVGSGPVLWDEYFHGSRSSLLARAAGTPVAWGALQLGVGTLLALFTYARRRGPVIAAAKESRLSPLEFANTMGGLYKRADAWAVPVEVSYRSLRFELVRRLGVPATVTDAELAHGAGERFGMDEVRLRVTLERAAGASIGKNDALPLVQELERFRAELR